MDTLAFIFTILTGIIVFSILAMNLLPTLFNSTQEGFETPTTINTPSIQTKIKAILEPLKGSDDLCVLYESIRRIAIQNEKADSNVSDSEAAQRVEKTLSVNIPGGALPCPLLVYPQSSSSDLVWLDWLQKIPDDFGARVVFMTLYARDYLLKQEQDVRDTLSGTKAPIQESFAICPPEIAKNLRNKNLESSCKLPESLSEKEIQNEIQKRLQTIVATKSKLLSAKNINPSIDLNPILQQAMKSKNYLESVKNNIESGTLPINSIQFD